MAAARRHDPNVVVESIVVFLCSFGLAVLSIALSREPGSIASVWLPNGAAIALCATAAANRRILFMLVACLAFVMANLTYDHSLLNALIFTPGNAIEIALGTYLLRRNDLKLRFANGSRQLLRTLVQGVLAPTLLGSVVGASIIHLVGYASFSQTWSDWFIGVTLGSATTLPLTLNIRSNLSLKEARTPAFWLVLFCVAAYSFCCLLFFPYPFGFISVMLLAIAFFSSRLTSFAAAPLVVLVFGVSAASGLWSARTADTQLGHAVMYLTLLFVVIPPQMVAVLVARKHVLEDTLTAVGSQSGQIAEFIDIQGELRWANKARETYLSTPNDQSVGKHWESSAQSAAEPLVKAALNGVECEKTASAEYSGKGIRTMLIKAQPAFDEEGQQSGVLLTSTDITEIEASRKRQQELTTSLELANQDLKQFLRMSSHDLVEPLNTVRQFSSLIELHDPKADWSNTLEYLGFVQSATARIGATLDDIRTYIQIDEAVCEQRFEAIDLKAIVEQLVQQMQLEIDKTGAEFSLNLSGTVSADKQYLVLAIKNLVSNAMKFVSPGTHPRVRITSDHRGNHSVIEVADNGIGIPLDKLELLGEPFKRLHARRHYDGTGLGLAICKRIAQKHGGHLEISSIPDCGSRFAIVLPNR